VTPTKYKEQTLKETKPTGIMPEIHDCGEYGYQLRYTQTDILMMKIAEDIKKYKPSEIAVLGRSVKGKVFYDLQLELKKVGIPYTVRGGLNFLKSDYVKKY